MPERGGIADLTRAVAALSRDPGLTEDRVEQIIRDAVAQHIEITGEVHIGAAPVSEGSDT
ncbi:hypothetical protein [Amycolatopsis cihanbeyliensis]|uniref:Uncharacterized protein n=1 Tax=Amycolatopsis cihanbeyliensis TaxID=1128664 RepID=A0A542DMG4_AMYCI|nr:hypothetical protein [Amycolatopsis cihanbeyliensis]TQJ04278.1 hypothetical protein FB471_4064 [Amycolatopsis cihanbeyliensis]